MSILTVYWPLSLVIEPALAVSACSTVTPAPPAASRRAVTAVKSCAAAVAEFAALVADVEAEEADVAAADALLLALVADVEATPA